MKKKTKSLVSLLIILLIITIYLVLKFVPIFVSINGDTTINIEVNSEYIDEGAINPFTRKQLNPIGNVDTTTIGKYKVAYKSFIQTLYRNVNVIDTTAPKIELIGKDIFLNPNEQYLELGANIIDNYDKDLSNDLIITNNINNQIPGQYEVEYRVSDSSGNVSETIKRNVYVIEDDFNYLNKIDDKFNLDESIIKNITDYLNLYYKSIKYLKPTDFSDLFSKDYLDNAYLVNSALDALVTYRNDYSINDLKLDDCSYSIETIEISNPEYNTIKVTLLEDSSVNFHHLNGISSKQAKVYNYFYLVKENDEYKLSKVEKEEGVFLYFDKEYKGNGIQEIDNIKDNYLKIMHDSFLMYEKQRQEVNNGQTYTSKAHTYPYDRNLAKAYAIKYGDTRNPDYDDYESNCNNFVSQCMYAGGIKMDSIDEYQWKYYNSIHDETTLDYGFTYSWTYIPSFIDYLENGDIVCSRDINLYFGEAGDVLAVDMIDQDESLSPHVILISDQIKDDNGNIIDLLICGNTNDQVNYPLSAMGYAYKKLIKIEGNK